MKDSWRNWPVRGAVIGIAVVSALAFVYLTNVQDREHYLQSRNFRLLAVLARQTEQLIDSRSRVYGENITRLCGYEANFCDSVSAKWAAWPNRDPLAKENPATQELAAGEIHHTGTKLTLKQEARHLSDYESQVTASGSMLQYDWLAAGAGAVPSVSVRVSAADTLHGTFDPRLKQGAFDTVLLADSKGRIIYVTGRRAGELRSTSIADLLALPPDATTVTRSASERPVTIAGVGYRMFMQPCCRADSAPAESAPFIVIGLVEKQALLEASLAISPVLVLAGVVLVIGLLVSWSFLKVALIGSQQRVTRIDVLQLGASGIFGLALVTILLLTSSAYARLSADVDAQLAQLAGRLHKSLSNEVGHAASQLNGMASRISSEPCMADEDKKPRLSDDPCPKVVEQWSKRGGLPPDLSRDYPAFSAFTLIDMSGLQRLKAAPSEAARRRVDVSDRLYFSRARDRDLWQFDQCPRGCVFEQLWSWTTGKFQVVMSTPTQLKHLPVAALSTSMKALLEPVLPPGFEFAIIDAEGQVQFHSDKQRILNENLLLETDEDARLRSLVATHGAGTLNTPYWGRPYRAYVRPTFIPGWSIVTLHAKEPSRALVLEWSTVALLMQGGYMLLWIALTFALTTTKASWLWPDPRRRPWYPALSIVYIVALLAWLMLAARVSTGTTIVIGLLVPPALWGITCVTLIPRPAGTQHAKAWSSLRGEYRVAAALMLTITAAVPATCFFMLSAEQHLLAYLKKQHIEVSRDVDVVEGCPKRVEALAWSEHQRYEDVFYGSHVTCQEAHGQAEDRTPALLSRVEEYLPYFTSASAPLRQLMHERSNDDAWTSDTSQPGRLSVAVAAREPGYRLSVESPVLSALGITSLGDEPHLALTAGIPLVMLVCVAFGAYWIVGYLLRRVVLADVVEPVPTNGHLVTSPGQHTLVICEDPAALAGKLAGDVVQHLMPIVTLSNISSAWRQARRTISEAGTLQRIVIPDLDEQADDVALMRRKLALIEELMGEPDLTVLVLTRMSRRALVSSVRGSWKWNQEPERWSKIVARLSVVNLRLSGTTGPTTAPGAATAPERWWSEMRDLLRERADNTLQWWKGARSHRNYREELLDAEATGCRTVAPFCAELKDSPALQSLSEDQILEELEERAGSIYRNVWQSCDENERVVLEHVAQYGLTSTMSRRVARRLLARGLLRKDPELRLMNRSFQRFVLEAERRREVVILESQTGPSLWDRLRIPLGAGALIGVTFLAATQREAFNATLTMATGVTGLVPMLMKFTNLLTQFTPKGGDQKLNG
jgi:hypothetical protein